MPSRLRREDLVTTRVLAEKGEPQSQIARVLGVAEGPVRYPLRRAAAGAHDGCRDKPFKAEAVAEVIAARFARQGARARPVDVRDLYEPLQAEHGYAGSFRSVVRYVGARSPRPALRTYRRVETPPGAQTQTDGAEYPRVDVGEGPEPLPTFVLHAFVMVLSHSRRPAVVWSRRQDQLHRWERELAHLAPVPLRPEPFDVVVTRLLADLGARVSPRTMRRAGAARRRQQRVAQLATVRFETARRCGSVAGGHDAGSLDHENHSPLRSARPVHHPFRNGEPLPRPELDRPALQVDHQTALHHVEELVFPIVLVPVELSLHDAEPYDAVVHTAERLVVPGVPARVDERLNVDELEGRIPCVQVDRVGCSGLHEGLLVSSVKPLRVAGSVPRPSAIRSRRGRATAR